MQNSLTAAPSTAGWQWPFSVSTQSRDWVYACDAGPGKPTACSAMTSIWCYAVACGKTSLPCLTFSNSFTWGCLIPLRYSCSYFVILLYFLRTPLLLSPCELGADEGSYTHSYSFPNGAQNTVWHLLVERNSSAFFLLEEQRIHTDVSWGTSKFLSSHLTVLHYLCPAFPAVILPYW